MFGLEHLFFEDTYSPITPGVQKAQTLSVWVDLPFLAPTPINDMWAKTQFPEYECPDGAQNWALGTPT